VKRLSVPGPKARELLARDERVVSPSYVRCYPLVMEQGKGSEVWDVDGNRFIDFFAGLAVCSTGHSHPEVVKAIKRQADRFLHISSDFYHPTWIEFSEALAGIAPFKEPAKVFVANSGTEAVEAAIKLARHHTGRQTFIGFYGAFHGRTMGSLAFTARKSSVYRRGFQPLMAGVTHIPFPDPYRPIFQTDSEGEGEAVLRFLEETVLHRTVAPEDCAAILLEPIQGEGGYIIPPDNFLPGLRKLCDKYGILLVVDEIQSGMGRTGKWWAIEHWGVEPDIVCSAKGIASGLPLGAIIARESVMDWPYGSHGNTFGGNPVACAAGLATIKLIGKGMMANAVELGAHGLDAVAEIASRHPSVGHFRGKGLMIGLEFVKDRKTKEHATVLRDRIVDLAFAHGLLLAACGDSAIRLAPPLNITKELLDEGLEILDYSIGEAETAGLD
jgi:4-aminobutyrate aminotransferase